MVSRAKRQRPARSRAKSRVRESDEDPKTSRVFWVLIAVVGVAIFVFGLRPALREREFTRREMNKLQRDVDEARDAVLRRDLESHGLQHDRDEIERRLRDQGYTAAGEVRLVPQDSVAGRRESDRPPSGR